MAQRNKMYQALHTHTIRISGISSLLLKMKHIMMQEFSPTRQLNSTQQLCSTIFGRSLCLSRQAWSVFKQMISLLLNIFFFSAAFNKHTHTSAQNCCGLNLTSQTDIGVKSYEHRCGKLNSPYVLRQQRLQLKSWQVDIRTEYWWTLWIGEKQLRWCMYGSCSLLNANK